MFFCFLASFCEAAQNLPAIDLSDPTKCETGYYFDTMSYSCKECPAGDSYLCKTGKFFKIDADFAVGGSVDECPTGYTVMFSDFCVDDTLVQGIQGSWESFESADQYIDNKWSEEYKEMVKDSFRLYSLREKNMAFDTKRYLNFWGNNAALSGYDMQRGSTLSFYELINKKFPSTGNNRYSYNGWPDGDTPFLLYPTSTRFDIVTTETIFNSRLKFSEVLQFQLATYSANGTFKGFQPLTLQMNKCNDENKMSQIWRKYGTNYKSECFIDLARMVEEETTDFFEPFLQDGTDASGKTIIRPFPLILWWTAGMKEDTDVDDYIMSRRYFLMDNYTNMNNEARFVNSVRIQFDIQGDAAKIYPPHWELKLYSVKRDLLKDLKKEIRISEESDTHPAFSFEVVYQMSMITYEKWFLILPIVLGVLALLFLISKVINIAHVDGAFGFESQNVFSILCAILDTVGIYFFVICLLFSSFNLIFFKWQKDIFWCLPDEDYESFRLINTFMIISLVCEIISVLIHVFVIQTNNHVFLIDWESPHADGVPVSAWRRINVANEWGKILTVRSSNVIFTVIIAVFVLKGFHVDYLSTAIPTTELIPTSNSHFVLRFAVDTLIWLLLMVFQYIWCHFVYWRFYGNPYFNFLDLCSTSNISVFITTSTSHGYYLHGRYVNSHSDVDMKKLSQGLADEEEGLVGLRGLVNDSTDQVFECFFASDFAQQYSQMKQNILLQQKLCAGRHSAMETPQQALHAYKDINSYLRKFFDGSSSECGWKIEEASIMQNFFGNPPQMNQSTFNVIKDNMFKKTMLGGCEWYMMLLYMVMFTVIDIKCQSPAIAGFVVVMIDFVIVWLYEQLCNSILARTTLMDSRFLLS